MSAFARGFPLTVSGRLASNPHVSKPTPKDYVVHSNEVRSTFLDAPDERWNGWHAPDYASPQHAAPGFDRTSAMQGQFSMSFGGAQRFLRTRLQTSSAQPLRTANAETPSNAAPKPTLIERLIRIAGREVDAWLQQTVHLPDTQAYETPRVLVAHPDGTPLLVELRRSPTALVWKVDDAYDRLAVHCVARVLECPSFSRTVPAGGMRAGWHAERHTWVLNPNPLLRSQPRRRRRMQHRRGSSSSSTSASIASSTGPPLPGQNPPLAAGILQQCIAGLDTPPSTEVEESDGADAESLADSLAESLADSLTVSQAHTSVSEESSREMHGHDGMRR